MFCWMPVICWTGDVAKMIGYPVGVWWRWRHLTLDQRRRDLDGTSNSCEHMIGWWAKERCRTMRGYKRAESTKNVVNLTARLEGGQARMAERWVSWKG